MFYNIEARRALLDLESRSKLFYTFSTWRSFLQKSQFYFKIAFVMSLSIDRAGQFELKFLSAQFM